jgi:hypothetical protein
MRNTKDAPNAVPRNGIRSVAKIGFRFHSYVVTMQKYKVSHILSITIIMILTASIFQRIFIHLH